MKLPELFIKRMTDQLGEASHLFLETFNEKPFKGLRVNASKIDVATFLEKFPYELTPVPWTEDGFYYKEEDDVTKHPFYYAGLYYIQEPSAMAPGHILNVSPGDVVLDLCAAPGGKTLQIANKLKGQGLLVSNDINGRRVKAIVKNIEKFGIKNAIVLNTDHVGISEHLGGIFDKVLIDAPCSGEGMFRKDKKAVLAWEDYNFDHCCQLQEEILKATATYFKNEGELVYSTCTYNTDENEGQIDKLTTEHGFVGRKIDNVVGISVDNHRARIWPHLHKGEGHFIARLQYKGKIINSHQVTCEKLSTLPTELSTFCQENMRVLPEALFEGPIKVIKGRVYMLPKVHCDLKGLRLAREGWLLGEIKNKRFIPHQAFAMGLMQEQVKRVVNFTQADLSVIKYLKCETLRFESEKGWHLVCVEGFPLGWGKHDGKVLKNYYPASWRMQ